MKSNSPVFPSRCRRSNSLAAQPARFILGWAFLAAAVLAAFALRPARADYPSTVLSQNPVGYWRLSETVQPPTAQSANDAGSLGAPAIGQYLLGPKLGEPGALTGSSATSVRFFNPTQDPTLGKTKVEVPYLDALNPSGPFSVEFWAKPSMVVTDVFCMAASLNSDSAIAPSPNSNPRAGWLFYQRGSTNGTPNQWQFRLGNASSYLDNDAIRGGTVTTGTWHHIVGTYDGTNATLYVNGVQVASGAISGYQPNDARPFRIGTTCFDGALGAVGTFAGNRGFDGWLEEVAFYGSALSASDISAHYNAGKSNGATYPTLVLADHPLGYWRLGEPGNPPALNLGSLGANGDAEYVFGSHPGQPGPQNPPYVGFEATNRACAFTGTSGSVQIPALNLNTNTVTMTAWVLADTTQTNNTGIVFCRSGTTVAGLKFDINDPNGLSYNWNDSDAAKNFKSSLTLPIFQWAFVALMVRPDQATLCLQDGNQFSAVTNFTTHPPQAFEGNTLIGADSSDPNLTFNGVIDEVAIFNRTLSVGEVYTEYAAAAGGLAPKFFTDLQAPAGTVYVGDTLTLSVDAGGTPPLSYEWHKDAQILTNVTSGTFEKSNITSNDAGTYYVIVSNAQGPITSQKVTISVQGITQPAVTQDPQGRTVYQGGLLNLSVQATGGGLTYQWQRNSTNIVGATNAFYEVTSATGNDSGTYQVIVSNAVGSVPSNPTTFAVVVPKPGSYEDLVIQDQPEAWWRLDDSPGSTTTADAMGRHDGAFQGGVTLGVPGALVGDTNSAASFDGSSGYAEIPYSPALNTTNFTIECWVQADPLAAAMCPIASFTQPPGRGYLIQKSEDGLWYYMFGNGVDSVMYYSAGSDAIYNDWVHLAITYDGNSYNGYLNGVLDAASGIQFVPNNIAPLRIGFDQTGTGWNDLWSGQVDEVAFYSSALSSDQLLAHYSAARYGTKSKPIFTKQPESSVAGVGTPFFFDSRVAGDVPLQAQWTKNGVPLPTATNTFLLFTNLTYSDTGVYQLMATNAVGSAVSTNVTLVVVPTPAFANVTNDLVLHLKFDRDYTDYSGHTNNATAVGSPTFVAGIVGSGAFHYSTTVTTNSPNRKVVSAANYATLGMPSDLQFSSNVNFSVSYWVRFTGLPGDLPFLCSALNSFSNPGFTFAPSYQAGGWSWSLGDVVTSSFIGIYGQDGSINDGQWHHLAHTFDRTGSGITYLDGFEVDSRSIVPAGDLDSGNSISIGQDPSGAYPEAGAGDIDDLGIWRRVLTPFEVYSIYSAGQNGASFDANGQVSLAVSSDAGFVQLAWQAGTLYEAPDLAGPWSPVSGATAPYFRVSPTAARKFYRVQL
jgi:hypothetical protein